MRRTDWWVGVLLIVLALLVHPLLPRYEYHHPGLGYAGNVASGAFYTDGATTDQRPAQRSLSGIIREIFPL